MDELYARSRLSLLDVLEALSEHRDGVILIGAHAVYMYTGEADVPIATRTKDSDLALDPSLLGTDPRLEEAMVDAGFHRNLASGQPGEWLSADGIPVDLLAPSSLVDPGGRRGARIPPHSSQAARKVNGLEAAVVDNRELWIEALDPDDPRRILTKVAGPAALTVSKAFKLGERQAIQYLDRLFDNPSSLGSQMAGQAEEGIGDPEIVAASVAVLVADLGEGIALVAD